MTSCAGTGSFAHTDLSLLLKESVRLCQLVSLLKETMFHIVLLYICTGSYMVNRSCCFVLVSFFHPCISFQSDQVHNCSSLCGHIKICTGIYMSEWSGAGTNLGEVRTAGSLGCFFFACRGGSCSEMFIRLQIHR